LDETYDEMIHEEFSLRGEHQAMAAAAEPELSESPSPGRQAAPDEPGAAADERPRGLQRYRTAALVGAGGLACAAAGAFLGGLGGYFTISPAVAHPVAAPITQDLPFPQAIGDAAHSSPGAKGTSAVTAARFSEVFGALTKGIAPFASLTSEPFGHGGKGSGKGGGAGNGTAGGGSGGGGGGGSGLAGGGVPVTIVGTSPDPVVGALTPVLNTVGSMTSGLGSTGTAIPSLPLPPTTGTALPIPALPSTLTPTPSAGGGPTTSNVALPVPAPVSPPAVTIGGLSVGVSGSGAKSGLTLTLP
jgi:hypothetical protein